MADDEKVKEAMKELSPADIRKALAFHHHHIRLLIGELDRRLEELQREVEILRKK